MDKRHQDYATWIPANGQTVYTTREDWEEKDCEWAHVIVVSGQMVKCVLCGTGKKVYKLTCDTPGFLATPEGICLPCLIKTYSKDVRYKDGRSC